MPMYTWKIKGSTFEVNVRREFAESNVKPGEKEGDFTKDELEKMGDVVAEFGLEWERVIYPSKLVKWPTSGGPGKGSWGS